MRWVTCIFAILVIVANTTPAFGDDNSVWVGRSLHPKRCLEIAEGAWEVKHKLCTIRYDMRFRDGSFDINGRLRFDDTQVPANVSQVDLEILLIDENRICTRQLNQRASVQGREVTFTFTTQKTPEQHYLRTYYVIYYK